MKLQLLTALMFCYGLLHAQNKLPLYNNLKDTLTKTDWLITPVQQKAQVYTDAASKQIILYNGLVKRVFALQQNVACIDYKNMSNGQQLLRAIKPEAVVTINNIVYNVGGLYGQKENAYLLPQWLQNFTDHDNDFHFTNYTVTEITPFIKWKPTGWATNTKQPTGKELVFNFNNKLAALKNIIVQVHYELYDGLPL